MFTIHSQASLLSESTEWGPLVRCFWEAVLFTMSLASEINPSPVLLLKYDIVELSLVFQLWGVVEHVEIKTYLWPIQKKKIIKLSCKLSLEDVFFNKKYVSK